MTWLELKHLICGCSTNPVLPFYQKGEATRNSSDSSKGRSPYVLSCTLNIMLLQKWQTNEIFKAIESASLNPSEFEFKNSDTEAFLKHRWSKSYFVIGGNEGTMSGVTWSETASIGLTRYIAGKL
jgi:hypothetical protein